MAQISLAKKYVAKKHQDYSNNHILLIYTDSYFFNVKYEFSEKTYYRSIPYTDKDKQESIWDRERCFVAQEISEWRVDELEDWQRDLIEKIRVGVELKDDDIVKAMGY